MDHLCCFCLVLTSNKHYAFTHVCLQPGRKGLTSWLPFVMSNCMNCDVVTFPLVWYPGSGVVLDCVDS